MNNEDYIKKWLEGSLNPEEKTAFEKSGEYESLQKLSRSVNAFRAPEYDVEAEYQLLVQKKNLKSGKTVKINWTTNFLKIAAALAIIAVAFIILFSNEKFHIETSVAEKASITLPDASTVILNASSTLSYNENTWEENREIKLTGEAFFSVAKGSTFKVITNDGTVEVLGTQFNVNSREGYFKVICYEGLVQVSAADQKTKLPPSYVFESVNGMTSVEQKEFYSSPHLPADESAFYSVPFHEVIAEFKRHYNVDLTLRNVDHEKKFTGRFTHNDIDLALQSISIPFNLSYEITENKGVILTGESD